MPHTKETARNGEASLIPLRDGSLLLMYGAHEKSGDWDRGEIRGIRSRDGGKTWAAPTDIYRSHDTKLWVDYPANRWIDGNLHLVWRHIRSLTDKELGGPGSGAGTSLYHHVLSRAALEEAVDSPSQAEAARNPPRILSLGGADLDEF